MTVASVQGSERIFASKVERQGARWSGAWPRTPVGESEAVVLARHPVYALAEFVLQLEPNGLERVLDCRSRPWRHVEFEIDLPEVGGLAFLFVRPVGSRDP